MEDGRPFQVSVDSRVMIDAKFFHKINPNYTRPRVVGSKNAKSNIFSFDGDDSTAHAEGVTSNGKKWSELEEDELLIYCPTVPGFSLGDKLWRKSSVQFTSA